MPVQFPKVKNYFRFSVFRKEKCREIRKNNSGKSKSYFPVHFFIVISFFTSIIPFGNGVNIICGKNHR